MKKIIVILFVISTVFCCQKRNKDSINIQGNWSLVNPDSTYYEIEFQKKYIKVFNIDYSFLPYRPYFIEGDSLFMRLSENDKKTYSYLIEQLNSARFILKSNTFQIKLFKIDSSEFTLDKIKDFEVDKLGYEVGYLNRKNKLFGIDYRHNLDSITKSLEDMKVPKLELLEVN